MINRIILTGCNFYYSHYIFTIEKTETTIAEKMCLCFVIKGSASIRLNNKFQILNPGDLFFFSPKTFYSITSVSGIQVYGIELQPDFSHSFCPNLESVRFNQFHISGNSSDQIRTELYALIGSFLYSNVHENEYFLLKAISFLNQAVILLCEHYQAKKTHTATPETDALIERILSYIFLHMHEPLRVAEISQEIGFHPQYFSIFFSRHFHVPFIEFLNQLRIDHSIPSLCSDDSVSITDVAIQSGFQTYKAYSNAFHKCYHMSPSQYRKAHLNTEGIDFSLGVEEIVQFCLKQLDSSLSFRTKEIIQESVTPLNIKLDLLHSPTIMNDHRFVSVNIGTAYLLLQDRLYLQLGQVIKDCHIFTHIHISDIFSDILKVYSEKTPGNPQFYWGETDIIIERIRSLGCYPFIELGYMPRQLAASADAIKFGYYRCTGVPASYRIWKEMISSFLKHYLHKYGMEDIKNWKFDFWASANLQSRNGFWYGTQEQFFTLYRMTYEAFQELSPELKPGSPNFSLPNGLDWYEAFFSMCKKHNIRPDYLNINLYDVEDNIEQFRMSNLNPPSTYNYLSTSEESTWLRMLRKIQALIDSSGFRKLPIVASLWNTTYSLTDLIRDTSFMACYIIHTWIQTMPLLEGLSFFCLSDMNESIIPADLFSGSAGMLSCNGIARPAYNAFYLLQKMETRVVYNQFPCLITKGNHKFHVLAYNLCEYEKNDTSDELTYLDYYHRYQIFSTNSTIRLYISLTIPPGNYCITRYSLDRDHGSAYDEWIRMGSPSMMSEEMINVLKASSHPSLFFEEKYVDSELRIRADIKPHGVVLFEINKKNSIVDSYTIT